MKLQVPQLEQKDSKINDLQSKVEKQTRLTESKNTNEAKIKALTEKLVTVQTEAEKSEETFKTKLEESRAATQKNAKIAKAYKAKYDAVLVISVVLTPSIFAFEATYLSSTASYLAL